MLGCSSRSIRNVAPLPVPAQRDVGPLDDIPEVVRVAAGRLDRLPGRDEPLGGVLAQGLEHPVAAGRAASRPRPSTARPAGRWCRGPRPGGRPRRRRPPPPTSSVQPPWNTDSRSNTRRSSSLSSCVAPVHRGPQRLLPCLGGAGSGGEQGEPVREPFGDLDRRHRRDPGGGELERERHAVEGRAIGADRGQVVRVEHQPGPDGAGPFGEQLRGGVPEHRAGRDVRRRRVQRPDRHLHLVGDGERLPAGGEHRDVGAVTEDVVDERGGRVDDVLAVVDQEQQCRRWR